MIIHTIMETTFKKRPSSDTAQEKDNDKQQQHGKDKETRKDKRWWEQLARAIPDDKEEQKKWYKLLANPVVIIAGLISLGYWWINKEQKLFAKIQHENEELKDEINQLKKKYRKLKKRMKVNAGYEGKPNRNAILD